MLLFQTALVALLWSQETFAVECGFANCTESDGCLVGLKGTDCQVACGNKGTTKNDCMKIKDGKYWCSCKGDYCHMKANVIKDWRKDIRFDTSLSHVRNDLTRCVNDNKEFFSCGALKCLHDGKRYKSCALQFDEHSNECHNFCSEEDGSKNDCDPLKNGEVTCLCKGENCVTDGVVKLWKNKMNSVVGFTGRMEKCYGGGMLSTKGCGRQKCFAWEDKSCIYDFAKDGKTKIRCSELSLKNDCKALPGNRMQCSCAHTGSIDCDRRKHIIRLWKKNAKNTDKTFTGLDKYFQKVGYFSNRFCGDQQCFKKEFTCSLFVETNGCGIRCSEAPNTNKCRKENNKIVCLSDSNGFNKPQIIQYLKNTLKKEQVTAEVQKCLVEQKILSNKHCNGKQCFSDESGSCSLSFNAGKDGCDVECSAKTPSNECKKTGDKMECLSDFSGFNNPEMIKSLRKEQKLTKFKKNVKTCLVKQGVLSGNSCGQGGRTQCFSKDLSCSLSFNSGKDSCDVECSAKTPSNECKKTGDKMECLSDFSGFNNPEMIKSLRKEQKLTKFKKNVKTCLVKQGVLSGNSCGQGGRTQCFSKDLSCSLSFNSGKDSCDVECSAKLPSHMCKKNRDGMECLSDFSGFNKPQIIESLRKEQKLTKFKKNVKTCLVKQGVLSGNSCGQGGGTQCFSKDLSCKLSFKTGRDGCEMDCSTEKPTHTCKKDDVKVECRSGLKSFWRIGMIQYLQKKRENTPFTTDLDTCLEQQGLLNGKRCGDQECFRGQDYCRLVFDENKCSVGCTDDKEGANNRCKEITEGGIPKYECLCEGNHCFTKKKVMLDMLLKRQREKPFSNNLERCLIRKDILTDKTCDKKKCFAGQTNSCEITHESGKQCQVACSSSKTTNDVCTILPKNKFTCYCTGNDCEKQKSTMKNWQKLIEDESPALSDELDQCLEQKSNLKLSSKKCGDKTCSNGRDESCKVVVDTNGSQCKIECSHEAGLNHKCTAKHHRYQCYCNGDNCYKSKNTIYNWLMFIDQKLNGKNNIIDCVRQNEPATTVRPLRKVHHKIPQKGVFEGETMEQLMARLEADKAKKANVKSGFTFKWWYIFLIVALLASIGLFGIVIWSAATRKKRCAAYWKKKEEEKKKNKTAPMTGKHAGPSKEVEMETIPEKDVIKKGPHHLQKKFTGEMTHLADIQKSESIHEKLEFVPQLNEEVEIGSDVEIIDGMEQTSFEDTSASRSDNFNTVRQASSMSSLQSKPK